MGKKKLQAAVAEEQREQREVAARQCKNCGGQIKIMIFKGTRFCCVLCEKAFRAKVEKTLEEASA